jgi:hypothetical protein
MPNNNPLDKKTAIDLLRIPLVIDGTMAISLIIGGTVMWQQQGQMSAQQRVMGAQIVEIQKAIESDRMAVGMGRVGSTERLARIEERLISVQDQLVDVKKELRQQ